MEDMVIRTLEKSYKAKTTVFLLGVPGIGKSERVYKWAEMKANDLGKKFAVWHELTLEEKYEVVNNVKDYFILVDLKLQSIGSPEKISGVPIILNHNTKAKIVWQPPLFVEALSKKEATGVLFLDEFNMALQSLQSLAFEITLQKKIGEWKLSNNVSVVCAGNPMESNIAAQPLSEAIRGGRVVMLEVPIPSPDEWISWATKNDIDARIISFVKCFGESVLYKVPDGEEEPLTCPRSHHLLSKHIKGEDDINFIRTQAESCLDITTASKFIGYVKNMYQLDYRKFLRDFDEFTELSDENQYAIITLIAQNIKHIKQDEIVSFIQKLSGFVLEYAAILLSLIKVEHGLPSVKKILRNLTKDPELIRRIGYLVI